MTKPEQQIIRGKHKLSQKEKIEVAEDLAQAMQEKERLQEKLKSTKTEIQTEIDIEENKIKVCLDKIRTGEEDRDYICDVERDYEKKVKNFIDKDSGRIIKTMPFNASDYQHELGDMEQELSETEENEEEENDGDNSGDGPEAKPTEMHVLTEEDLIENPELAEAGLKPGDEIELGKLKKDGNGDSSTKD